MNLVQFFCEVLSELFLRKQIVGGTPSHLVFPQLKVGEFVKVYFKVVDTNTKTFLFHIQFLWSIYDYVQLPPAYSI